MPSATSEEASSERKSALAKVGAIARYRPLGRRSIRFRLTALFTALLAVTLIFFSTLLYSAFVRNQSNEFDAALYNHAVDLAKVIDVDPFGDLSVSPDALAQGGKIFPFSVGRSFLQVLDTDGKIIARSRAMGNAQLPSHPDDWQTIFVRGYAFRTLSPSEVPAVGGLPALRSDYRLLTYVVRQGTIARYVLQVAVPMSLIERERKTILAFLFLAIPLTLLFAIFGGLYLSGKALAPVAAIIEKANDIGAARLSERLPIPAVDDEIRHLSLTLNDLLDRLQRAFESQERFIADASHQLKTPLAILRGELDLARSRPRSPEELSEFLQSASQELDYLSRMVEDLLLLARVDAGAGSLATRPVRLDEIALEAVSRLEVLAKAKNARIRFDLADPVDGVRPYEVDGDPDLLQSMFHNLIENAIKFSPEGGTVEVRAADDGTHVSASVRDAGPGIPADALPRIFERFFRVDSRVYSTTGKGKTPGFGLGLAIARRIAEAHGGSVSVESRESMGTTFTVRIKKL